MTTPNIPNKRYNSQEHKACCNWGTFSEGFTDHFKKLFGSPASEENWKMAIRDWRAGNTGYEAAHNARAREKDAAEKASAPAWVWIGGRNYALEGSDLAKRFGRPKPQNSHLSPSSP
ncbi:MAG: hypothetical protein EPN79_11690 [Burkholderiaceae bacterium]|nr:MAG: hypothetical protein EPN79_11690 [Burkholderiaceae bacterium]TBR76681.1 MAG: hypothetical protein EPN64_05375 [Burkholderiaceae bacterium]